MSIGHEVSVVVLSHNNLGITIRFLDAFCKHTDLDKVSLLWIDNGSSSATTDYLTNFLYEHDFEIDINLLFNDDNKGVIGGRNQGFDWFLTDSYNSPYLLFLDNDQIVGKNWLEQHLSVIKAGYDIVGIEAWLINDNFLPVRRNTHINQEFSYVGCGGMLLARYVVEKVGKFDIQFNPCYFEDPDYNFRVIDEGMKIGWNISANIEHIPHQTLGNKKDKNILFKNSFMKFKSKWGHRKVPRLKQEFLSEF